MAVAYKPNCRRQNYGISSFAPSYNSGMKALKNGIKLATMASMFIHSTLIANAITEIISTKSFISLVFGFRGIRVHQTPEYLLVLNDVRKP